MPVGRMPSSRWRCLIAAARLRSAFSALARDLTYMSIACFWLYVPAVADRIVRSAAAEILRKFSMLPLNNPFATNSLFIRLTTALALSNCFVRLVN